MRINIRKSTFLFTLLQTALLAGVSGAQELSFFTGKMEEKSGKGSYAWQIEYNQAFSEHFAWSFSWLNEGHVPDHHRDGPVLQVWMRNAVFDGKLALSAGIGPYKYFDTEAARRGKSFDDVHGWGVETSLSATWYMGRRWFLQVRENHGRISGDIDTDMLLLGIGYQLQAPDKRGPVSGPEEQQERSTNNEITAFAGQTVINSYNSQTADAFAFEYRRGLAKYLDLTVGWLNEGNTDIARRGGITAQLWPVRTFFDNRLALSAGFGAYFAVDSRRKEETNFTSGVLSMSASYRFLQHLLVRASWNRVMTNYNRDTDVMMAGLGVRF
ncbi:MAG: hypothetical protein WCS77_06525 [Elusimicrobiaceae bacterium]